MHSNSNNHSTVVSRGMNALMLKRERKTEREEEQGVASASFISIQSKDKMRRGSHERVSYIDTSEESERTAGERAEKKREFATPDICSWNSCKACLRSACVHACVCALIDSALRLQDQENRKKGHCIPSPLSLALCILLTLSPHNSLNPAAHSEQTMSLSTTCVRACVVFYIFTLPRIWSEVKGSWYIWPAIYII